jgi:uncharacterized protein (UPF0276 family)
MTRHAMRTVPACGARAFASAGASSAVAIAHAPIGPRAGVGLRFQHHREMLERRPPIAWLEAHAENYLGGGAAPMYLDAVRREYPLSLHGVGMSLGSAGGIDERHLGRIAALVRRVEPALVSEHLAWSVAGGAYLADLLPLPLTEEALDVVCRNVDALQCALRRTVLLENPSTCLRFTHSTIPEWEFLAAVVARTGCGILCDVNNVYVSACNHGFDASAYLAALPAAFVGEYHLAGHAVVEQPGGATLRIDDHGARVCPQVWALYGEALERIGPRPTLIEWDTRVPPLDTLLAEAALASRALAGCAAGGAPDVRAA